LIVDQGLPAATHRRHLLGVDGFYAENREIGVGYATNPDSTYSRYWAVHIGRQENPDVFLTGVVFSDDNGNARYDAGEGLPGISIQAAGRTAMSNEAGGFSLAVLPNGSYRIFASGTGLAVPAAANVRVTDVNVEVDIVSGVGGAYLGFAGEPTSAWTNPRIRLDVSDNQTVDPLDALQVINHLNTVGPGPLSPSAIADEVQPPFLDADGDGHVMPHDVLLVVNDLNRTPDSAEGEGGAGLHEIRPVLLEHALPSSQAADVHRTAMSSWAVAERGAGRRADLPAPVLRSSSPEPAVRPGAGGRIGPSHAEAATAGEELTAWWTMADFLNWELLAALGLDDG